MSQPIAFPPPGPFRKAILPLVFMEGDSFESLGLVGTEMFSFIGIETIEPGKILQVKAVGPDGSEIDFKVTARLNTEVEVRYFEHGGILPFVLRKLLQGA